jgi:hypothetical protein
MTEHNSDLPPLDEVLDNLIAAASGVILEALAVEIGRAHV